jgi:small subunit ribosomal protein S17
MADEEKNDTTEETPEEQAPEAEAPPEDAPADKGGDETPKEVEAPAADASSDGEAGDAEASADADDAGPDEMEGMDWKARKRLERSRESGEAGPQRSPEDLAKERAEQRGKAIKSRSSYRKKARQGGEAGTGTPPAERESAGRKERRGTVVSSKSDKTITVRIDTARRHPAYEKIVRESSTLRAHDESNEAGEGDLVRIVETRPLSKTKRWRLVEVMEKAK